MEKYNLKKILNNMAEAVDNAKKSKIAFIRLSKRECRNLRVLTRIIIVEHVSNETFPCIENIGKPCSSYFITTLESEETHFEVRLLIIECVMELFWKFLLSKDMIVWGLDPNMNAEELRDIIMEQLDNHPLLHGKSSKGVPVPFPSFESNFLTYREFRVLWKILKNKLYRWNFNKSIKASEFSLFGCSCITLTKHLVIAILRNDNKNNYFYQDLNPFSLKYHIYLSQWFHKLSLFSIFSTIHPEKLSVLRTIFNNGINTLRLPSILETELKSYFPPSSIW